VIEGVTVRELDSRLGAEGFEVKVWGPGDFGGQLLQASCRHVFPGVVQAWVLRRRAGERITCLQGMIKLVLCDRREGSPSRDKIMELYLGEFRPREVMVPPGVLMGWKAVGDRAAVVFTALEGESAESAFLDRGEAGVDYDWDIVMQ